MKGYKCLNENMCATLGDNMKYELGKEYTMYGDIKMGLRGYHFAIDLFWAFSSYYDIKNIRIFEVEATGEIIQYIHMYCTNKIKLVRELSKKEVIEYIKENKKRYYSRWRFKAMMVHYKLELDKLVDDADWKVRTLIAQQNYRLDKLVNDEDWYVRMTVARQGYGLDVLINDENKKVRQAAITKQYELNKLANNQNK